MNCAIGSILATKNHLYAISISINSIKKFIHRKMICTIVQTFQDLHPMMFLDCN
jgi:hypothetical protein